VTWFDGLTVLVLLGYTGLGYLTGVVRRVLGLAIVYGACVVATYMGPQGGNIWQQAESSTTSQDARLYGWVFFFLLVVVIVEAMATAIHEQLQVSVVMLNKFTGALIGLITGAVAVIAVFFMLAGFAKGTGNGTGLDNKQLGARDTLVHSSVGLALVKGIGPYVLPLMQAALPRDPGDYFASPATPTH